jgi:hypothetical protein
MPRRLRIGRSSAVALALVGAALAGPAGGLAATSTRDPDTGNTTPGGFGSAPDQPHGGSSSACTWTVKGHLSVRGPTLDGIEDGAPLAGVEVKVSGADSIGTHVDAFGKWGVDYTDAKGAFSVTHTECSARRVRVEAKFVSKSGDLRVLGKGSKTWYVLKDTNSLGSARLIDLGDEPFGGETGDQATRQARTDGQTWVLYRRAIDYVDSLGYRFLNDVTVHNPASIHKGDASWTDPVLHGIHIAPANTTSRWNMLHELGHAWAYPREKGEDCLIVGAGGKDNTHSLREAPCVAFNEGFADFFGSRLDQELSDAGLISPKRPSSADPYSRAFLVSNGVLSRTDAEHNELGFDQAFRVLTQADITRDLFGDGLGPATFVSTWSGPRCTAKSVPKGLSSLSSALEVIGDANDQFDVRGTGRPTLDQLFARADERLSGFDELAAAASAQIVDPNSDDEPHEIYGCSPTGTLGSAVASPILAPLSR